MLIYWRFIWRNTIALGWGRGGGMLAVDFNLGLKPQRFVFGGASWGAAGLGPRGEARPECGSATSPLLGWAAAAAARASAPILLVRARRPRSLQVCF